MENLNNDDWKKKYYDIKIVKLKDHLNEENINTLQKLDIHIEDEKVYTQYEYDIIKQKLSLYYNEEEDIEEAKEYKELLMNKDVSFEEYQDVIQKFDMIDYKYIYC